MKEGMNMEARLEEGSQQACGLTPKQASAMVQKHMDVFRNQEKNLMMEAISLGMYSSAGKSRVGSLNYPW